MEHLYQAFVELLPDLWRAVPAAVLALLAFGFRRMAARFLGVFTSIEELRAVMKEHLIRADASFKANDDVHKTIVEGMNERFSRLERLLEEQNRRIDSLTRGS